MRIVLTLLLTLPLAAQQHQNGGGKAAVDMAEVTRGKNAFASNCGFCHGNDATGSRAPDLVRSAILSHDENGNALAPVIRNGRADKGMPGFPNLKDGDVSAIVTFLHFRAAEALHSGHVANDYPIEKLLTGSASAGKAFFEGAGGCTKCHSATGDLAGVAKKFTPINLQQEMIYPTKGRRDVTATVIAPNGEKFEGKVMHEDEFNIGIVCADGWYRAWPRDKAKVEIHDPLQAHRDLTSTYSDADMHNLFAYLETLK